MIQYIVFGNLRLGSEIWCSLKNPKESGYVVASVTGLESPKSDISITDYALFDGGVLGNAKIEERIITINLLFTEFNNNNYSVEKLRNDLQNLVSVKDKIRFYVIMDDLDAVYPKSEKWKNYTTRYLIDGYVESHENNIFSKQEGANITLKCPDPYFTMYSAETFYPYVSKVEPKFHFEANFERDYSTIGTYKTRPNTRGTTLEAPVGYSLKINSTGAETASAIYRQKKEEFGNIKNNTNTIINYHGIGEMGFLMVVEATGDIRGISISNLTRNETLSLDDSKINAVTGGYIQKYDTIKISTVRGNKYAHLIRNGITYEITHAVVLSSKWPSIQTGDNVFSYTATSGYDKAYVHLEYQYRTLGI